MKILIITNSIEFITIVSNFITLNFNNNISILIANNINNVQNNTKTYNIDLIIIDEEILELNLYKQTLRYFPLILINSNLQNYNMKITDNINHISLDNLIYIKQLIFQVMNSLKFRENARIKILDELIKLGFNIKHNGTKYIVDAILILKLNYNTNNIKDVYAIISNKYNTTENNIKSNILKSINYMYYETEYSNLKSYFSLNNNEKPTPKQVILTILKNV